MQKDGGDDRFSSSQSKNKELSLIDSRKAQVYSQDNDYEMELIQGNYVVFKLTNFLCFDTELSDFTVKVENIQRRPRQNNLVDGSGRRTFSRDAGTG